MTNHVNLPSDEKKIPKSESKPRIPSEEEKVEEHTEEELQIA